MKPALIIVEGPQGVGKTTFTDYLRNKMPYTNLYRLSGTADKSPTGYYTAEKMYYNLLTYMKSLENNNINLLFDRTFFTEEIYSRLGYKEYIFTPVFNKLLEQFDTLDFDIYYITLYLKDTSLYSSRLNREGKANVKFVDFNINNSINQQNEYLKLATEVKEKTHNILTYNIANDTLDMSISSIDSLFIERYKK